MTAADCQDRPLEGIRVLDLSRLLPGPYLTMVLADLGADVVKIEDPRLGDYMRQFPPLVAGMSPRFWAVNRGKRSLALDLKRTTDRDALLRMVERADVVVESFRPGVLARLGVGYEVLSARNPRIILCSVSGYGQTGAFAERAGHDINYMALSGVLAQGGARGGRPALVGTQVADLAGGALWGVSGVLAALFGRERTGRGRHLDISMTEGALALLASEFGHGQGDAAATPTRGTGPLNGGLANYDIYRTADDKYLAVGSLEPKFYLAFHQAIGRAPDLSELVAEVSRQDEIRDEIQAVLQTKTREEWTAIFSAVDCCVEPVLELDELASHPLHQSRGVFGDATGPGGVRLPQVRTPLASARRDRLAPTLGEHSEEVLREYGFTDDEIARVAER